MSALEAGMLGVLRELVRDPSARETLRDLIREVVREERGAASGGEYLSTAAAARVADVAEGTIRRWIREGKLARHAAGRELRVRRDELERFLSRESSDVYLSPEDLAARDFG